MNQNCLHIFCLLLITGTWSVNSQLKEAFTTNLLKELASGGGNVVFSPTSMDTALSIVAYGARGQTEQEMYSTLGYNPESAKQVIEEKQRKLNEKSAPGAIWQSANRIMAAPDLPVKRDYLAEVSQAFPGVAVSNFDFESPERTAYEVNSWVSDKTNHVIKKLLEPNNINPNTRLIVLNAVYFKGEWKHGFDKKKTKKECFFSEPGKCTMTDMMHIKENFKYGYHNDMKAQIIEFPYKNEQFSMIVVLPDERRSNMTSLLANLNVDEIIQFIDEKRWTVEVHVTMPKFEIEFKKEMKDHLKNLGMMNLFTDASDLSGMISGLRASVDSVVHKAKITCDEEGTVAAAATGVMASGRTLIVPAKIYFEAKRPFIYLLRKAKSGVLFAGLKETY